MNYKHRLPSATHRVCFLCVLYPPQICSWGGKGLINIQWWHKMVRRVSDSFFFVVIKAVVKWPFCLLPQRLVFQYPEQMVCVFHGWITEPGGFCVAGLDYVKLVCMSSWLSCENTPVSVNYILTKCFEFTGFFYFLRLWRSPPTWQ